MPHMHETHFQRVFLDKSIKVTMGDNMTILCCIESIIDESLCCFLNDPQIPNFSDELSQQLQFLL